MAKDALKDMSLDELQSFYSDYHKDYYGFRPRGIPLNLWNDRLALISLINNVDQSMQRNKQTFEGREALRRDGWLIEETEPDYKAEADRLAKERERRLIEFENSIK